MYFNWIDHKTNAIESLDFKDLLISLEVTVLFRTLPRLRMLQLNWPDENCRVDHIQLAGCTLLDKFLEFIFDKL